MTASTRNMGWLSDPALQRLLAVLNANGEARVAGGAVRNALLGEPIGDVDVATTLVPGVVTERLLADGFKVVPTGIDHGTVTAVRDGHPYEVTTLREDVETDGRHATVVFGTDWRADAERRDLTMNALYMEADGTVFDPLGCEGDVHARRVRFVGEADRRIVEDHLRILRFFRFFAWYGQHRPDAEGLKACARHKAGVERLSVERVWSELRRMLAAPDPSRALLWMRQTGVLSVALPESEKWGIDAVPGLMAAEGAFGWSPDPLLRLAALLPPDPTVADALGKRLKMSNEERARLLDWTAAPRPNPALADAELARAMYATGRDGTLDVLSLALARARAAGDEGEADAFRRQLDFARGWQRPTFPVQGRDLIEAGVKPGPEMGERLKAMEARWIVSDFALTKDELLAE